MSSSNNDNPVWQAAWSWVLREHDRPLNSEEQRELVRWLKADPSHYKNYEEASRVWLMSALVPPGD